MSSLPSRTVPSGLSDLAYPLYPVCTSIGIGLILLPAYWQFKNGHVGTISYIVWIAFANLNALVNSISWSRNLHEPPWIWCDISAAFAIGLNVALPTSSFLITRSLYRVASIRQVHISDAERRRAKVWDVALAVGLPVLAIALHVVVQGHRADIAENWGCWPAAQRTPMAIGLVYMPPILINLASTLYAALVFRIFYKQRKRIREIVASPSTLDQYFRLMALAATEIVFCLPISGLTLATNVYIGIMPWISWGETHSNFNRIDYFPYIWFTQSPPWIRVAFTINRYAIPAAALLFFVYFGVSGDSGAFYSRQFWRLVAWLGFPDHSTAASDDPRLARPPPIVPSGRRNIHLPSNAPRNTLARTNKSVSTESIDSLAEESVSFVPLPMPLCFYEVKDLELEMGHMLRLPPPVARRSSVRSVVHPQNLARDLKSGVYEV